MNKKQQKWVALLVMVTFVWLLQVSTMPLTAAGTSEQIGSVSVEQGPDYYEAVGQKAAPAKKKSILPWILIGVGVVAVATVAVLFLFVLNNYNITGAWTFVFTGASNVTRTITFTGDKKSGTFAMTGSPNSGGTYAVNGKKVTMTPSQFPDTHLSGEFTGKDAMSGTLMDEGDLSNWTATRIGAAASVEPAREMQSKHFLK